MKKALKGIKVLDLTMNLPGPYMTWLMAQMGAEVVKVENPEIGDYARVYSDPGQETYLPIFELVNRGKKSITLNLKLEADQKKFMQLAGSYDIVVEGFRPGVMDKLKIDYATISKQHPAMVYVSITGYGQEGPYIHRAGHDLNYQALAGSFDTGASQMRPAGVSVVPVADLGGGSLLALSGLLAAFIERNRTGKGQHIEVSLYDGVFALNPLTFSQMQSNRDRQSSEGHFLSGSQPFYHVYETSDGCHMSLGAVEPKFWEAFCRTVGCEDLIERPFSGESGIQRVAVIIRSRTREEWTAAFKEVDACFEPILSLPEVIESPLCRERGLISRKEGGAIIFNSPIKSVGEKAQILEPPPDLGQHNQEILG